MKNVNSVDIARQVYRKHIRFYRYLNDAYIFITLINPVVKEKAELLTNSNDKKKHHYDVPKKGATTLSRRTNQDVGAVLNAYYIRGIFESAIVSVVSRMESLLQDILFIVIRQYPNKIGILGEKAEVPLSLILKSSGIDQILETHIRHRCEELMFLTPKDYVEKFKKVISIDLEPNLVEDIIEIKASRDLIVHGTGQINEIYVKKAAAKARGNIGDELIIDSEYFDHVKTAFRVRRKFDKNEIQIKSSYAKIEL